MKVNDFPKVTVILRGYTYDQIHTVVKNLIGTELKAVEITMNTPGALETIRKIREEFGDSILVGAGTVLTYTEEQQAISPTVFDKEILDLCRERGVISVPGAFSPSEIWKSIQDGADIVKVFPAGRLGSRFFSDIQAPLGRLPLMAVGGVNVENLEEFFNAGASFAGIASGIFNRQDIIEQREEHLRTSIREAEKKIRQLREAQEE